MTTPKRMIHKQATVCGFASPNGTHLNRAGMLTYAPAKTEIAKNRRFF
jgi:hypothetical protein